MTYIKAGFPLIWIKSYEEQRVLTECTHSLSTAKATDSDGNEDTYKVLSWDTVAGLRPLTINDRDLNAGASIEETAVSPFVPLEWLRDKANDNTIVFLNDYHPFLEKEFPDRISLTRLLKNLGSDFKAKGKALVIISAGCTIPMELEKDVALISYKLQ
jgi:hypothetical protein